MIDTIYFSLNRKKNGRKVDEHSDLDVPAED
jgi:hypothetical protein